jgi:hypothetical protein
MLGRCRMRGFRQGIEFVVLAQGGAAVGRSSPRAGLAAARVRARPFAQHARAVAFLHQVGSSLAVAQAAPAKVQQFL